MARRGVTIAVNIFMESRPQIEMSLKGIARYFPNSRRTVFLNGGERSDAREIADRFGFQVHCGENLGSNSTWHLWWLRMFHYFDNEGMDICFKLDPDTIVDRRPKQIPRANYFGHIEYGIFGAPFIQGGVTGLSLVAVREVIRRRLLERDDRKQWFAMRLPPEAAFADDQYLALVLRELGIFPEAWPECKSRWKREVLNRPARYAIVHPRYCRNSDE